MQALSAVDRQLFCRITFDLGHRPRLCLRAIALWKWLEEEGYPIIIPRLTESPDIQLETVVTEAYIILQSFTHALPPDDPDQMSETRTMMNDYHLARIQEIHPHRNLVSDRIRVIENGVIEAVLHNDFDPQSPADVNKLIRSMQHPQPEINNNHNQLINPLQVVQANIGICPLFFINRDEANRIPVGKRTLFVTFTLADDYTEAQLRSYFVRRFDENCIEQVRMGRVTVFNDDLPGYAHVVFRSADTIRTIFKDQEDQDQLVIRFNMTRTFVAGRFNDQN